MTTTRREDIGQHVIRFEREMKETRRRRRRRRARKKDKHNQKERREARDSQKKRRCQKASYTNYRYSRAVVFSGLIRGGNGSCSIRVTRNLYLVLPYATIVLSTSLLPGTRYLLYSTDRNVRRR